MNKPLETIKLENGIVVEFHTRANRYFGDYHRLQIDVIALIPMKSGCSTAYLQEQAEKNSEFITYEKTLERMGVATNEIEITIKSMMYDFIETTGRYLVKKHFAENLHQQKNRPQPARNRFSL